MARHHYEVGGRRKAWPSKEIEGFGGTWKVAGADLGEGVGGNGVVTPCQRRRRRVE